MLHRDGRRLIGDWYQRGADNADPFESFIYLWIGLNGWAACVSGHDADTRWRDALVSSASLNDRFAGLVATATETARAAHEFATLWPIFRVDELRRRGLDYLAPVDDRAQMSEHYREAGATQFEPRCFFDHQRHAPLDWAHTLPVLYQVRCNLFHGDKSANSENDRQIVVAAGTTLRAFIDEAALFGHGER